MIEVENMGPGGNNEIERLIEENLKILDNKSFSSMLRQGGTANDMIKEVESASLLLLQTKALMAIYSAQKELPLTKPEVDSRVELTEFQATIRGKIENFGLFIRETITQTILGDSKKSDIAAQLEELGQTLARLFLPRDGAWGAYYYMFPSSRKHINNIDNLTFQNHEAIFVNQILEESLTKLRNIEPKDGRGIKEEEEMKEFNLQKERFNNSKTEYLAAISSGLLSRDSIQILDYDVENIETLKKWNNDFDKMKDEDQQNCVAKLFSMKEMQSLCVGVLGIGGGIIGKFFEYPGVQAASIYTTSALAGVPFVGYLTNNILRKMKQKTWEWPDIRFECCNIMGWIGSGASLVGKVLNVWGGTSSEHKAQDGQSTDTDLNMKIVGMILWFAGDVIVLLSKVFSKTDYVNGLKKQ